MLVCCCVQSHLVMHQCNGLLAFCASSLVSLVEDCPTLFNVLPGFVWLFLTQILFWIKLSEISLTQSELQDPIQNNTSVWPLL